MEGVLFCTFCFAKTQTGCWFAPLSRLRERGGGEGRISLCQRVDFVATPGPHPNPLPQAGEGVHKRQG
ncbi:protein of unknown function (plasmid) [Cupriavidus neocaledonicus]|uniref:Uncharacterized protein n=1 Tax=Cupriavidus neocaledonicus TaxID=1040979 RepID=A0A375HUT1_9BURK|nr:hypothetical protein CBM2605_B10182 [Cupriavidus neocaledonicus]SPD61183.1 protein of unknown function [Cupriavidus neocaledonicus]